MNEISDQPAATDDKVEVIHGILAGTESGRRASAEFSPGVAEKILDVVKDSFVAGVQSAW